MDEIRGDVRCTCGQVWPKATLAEAQKIAFGHDDSPNRRHVVTSRLFRLAVWSPILDGPNR